MTESLTKGGTSKDHASLGRLTTGTLCHAPKAPATPTLMHLDRKKSSVVDLRNSFEKLSRESSQKAVRQFSLDSHRRVRQDSPREGRDRSSAMPQQSPERLDQETIPSTSGGKHASNECASPSLVQSTRRLANTGAKAEPFSSGQTEKHHDYVSAKVETASLISPDGLTRQTRAYSPVQREPKRVPRLLGPEGPTAPIKKSCITPSGPLHPFLRQQNSGTNKLKKLIAPNGSDVKPTTGTEKSRDVETPEELPPHHVHHTFTKVGNLCKFYDMPSATLSFHPFRRRQETATAHRRAVSGVFASSASPELIEHNTPPEGFGPMHSSAGVRDGRDEGTSGCDREDTARRSRNKLRKRKHRSPMKEKVSMFESLNRPASRLQMLKTRAKSFETPAVLKRGGEEVTNGFKKMAENGTRMWRRLSVSFDKERETHEVDAVNAPADSPDKPSSFRVLSSDIDQHKTHTQSQRPVIPPRRNPRRESTFLLTEPSSRIPRAVAHTPHSRVLVPNQSYETSDSSTSEVRDFAIDGNTESTCLRPRASHPVLPTLDFDVDGTPDMLRYFERNFDINISVNKRGTMVALGKHHHHPSHDSRHSTLATPRRLPHRDSRSTNISSHTSSTSRPSMNSYSHIPAPVIPPRHPGRIRGSGYDSPSAMCRKSHRASPVLSIHEARGDTRIRHQQPDLSGRRRKPAMSAARASHQRVWDVRRDTPRLGVVRGEEEMIYIARPPGQQEMDQGKGKGVIKLGVERAVVGEGKESEASETLQEEVVVVAEAQCGLAHPRPSRVLDLKRFVEFVKERSGALGKL